MSSKNYENQILNAIETVAKKAIEIAGYDKTIRGVISSLEDISTGKYKVKYQDSEIEAYSNNTSIKYSKGTLVNILVPNSDFSQNKIIIDAIDKNNVEYNTVAEEADQYVIDGGNAIFATQEFGLCSYHKNEIVYLYNRDNGVNDINFNEITFSENVKNNNKILCGAKFRTDFDTIQKRTGNFGIVYNIDFKNNSTGAIITKSYVIDVNSMIGSPYDLLSPTRQYNIYSINNDNYVSVKSIYIFSKDFENIDPDKDKNDIFVSAFELYTLREPTQQEAESYSLQLNKLGKGYFDETSSDDVTIEAILKLKNQETSLKVEYYWFRENSAIALNDEKYSIYGGTGWECLNEGNKTDDGQTMWITNSNTMAITKNDCEADSIKIKCVVVKDSVIITNNTVLVYNYTPIYIVKIESDNGTQFYFDNGHPTLTCLVNDEESLEYNYQWSYIDENGKTQILEETTDINNIYNAAASEYEMLLAQIESEIAMPAASQERLNELKAILDEYALVQRVDKNKIYNVDLTAIVNSMTFNCGVSEEDKIIGNADITIQNTREIIGNYYLNIINGTQLFNYDFNGMSPVNTTLVKPIEIKPLSFEIIDNQGERLDNVTLANCEIQWTGPKENTMLICNDSEQLNLTYSIADTYDNRKTNNNIHLKVRYKNLILEADTHFTFSKDGDPGTNGTDVVCKIVPNTEDDFNDYPMLTNGVPNFTPAATGKWFKVQLWKNGVKILESIDSTSQYTIEWSVLRNSYTTSTGVAIQDPSMINISGSTFSYAGYLSNAANIIKVQVTDKTNKNTYFDTLPLIIANIQDNDYTINLLKDTGFRHVMYTSNGKQPKYDNTTPFEIKVIKLINGYFEDISTISNEYQVNYQWNIKGSIFKIKNNQGTTINSFVEDTYLTFIEDSNLARNQKFLQPNEEYDGMNVTNALEVKILTANLTEIGKIFIPLHLYLDRYGLANLNTWDGNRIVINDNNMSDDNYILSPQVGAGTKENGTFTGIMIGSVKERNNDNIEQGLFGYHQGQRSIFLDAKTGNAEFGAVGAGRIILDAQSGGKIYGGNYSQGSSGMLIDLAKPSIEWGNGKFSINENGKLNAIEATLSGNITADSGRIAGYTIQGDTLYGPQVGMDAENGGHSAFWAGADIDNSGNAPFRVGHDGSLYASNANINGTITTNNLTATYGAIGNWSINNGAIKYNNNIYLGSNGSVRFGDGSHYIEIGYSSEHPKVSALNVVGSINFGSTAMSINSSTPGTGGQSLAINNNIYSSNAILAGERFYAQGHQGIDVNSFYICTGINKATGSNVYTSVWRQITFTGGLITYISDASEGQKWTGIG